MIETANSQSDGTIQNTIFGGLSKIQYYLKEIALHKMKFALVTGGSGYLGSHVCKLLKRDGWNVVVYDIKQPNHNYHDLVIQKDVCDLYDLVDLMSDIKFDTKYRRCYRPKGLELTHILYRNHWN